jgi:cytochrome P450
VSTSTDVRWDPSDPAFRADPYPTYELLQRQRPAYQVPGGSLVVTRYDDVVRTLRSYDFSRDVEANANIGDDPVALRRRDRRRAAKTILNLDPPDHTRLRRLVSQAFTPSSIERLRPRIQAMVDGVLDFAAERGSMELIDELAFPVPFEVISELLAMPTDRAAELRTWSQALTAAIEPMTTIEVLDAADRAAAELVPYLVSVVEERRATPGDDVLSALLAAEEAGDRLSPAELIAFVTLLYVAGHETTVNLIGNAVLALLRRPDQLDRWRADPSLDTRAIDELLRYDGPVQHTVRVALTDVAYEDGRGGTVEIARGQTVLTVLGAANHDASVFDDPHELRLDRPNANRHVAFAAGIHYCLGGALAKLEAEVVLTSLIRRFPAMQLDGEPRWRDRLTIRGVDRLQLTLR